MNQGMESNYSVADALTEVQEMLKSFVCFKSPDDLLITALYVLLTYCINPADGGFKMFPILPFLLITGDPGSGKTQLMKVLKRLCFRGGPQARFPTLDSIALCTTTGAPY